MPNVNGEWYNDDEYRDYLQSEQQAGPYEQAPGYTPISQGGTQTQDEYNQQYGLGSYGPLTTQYQREVAAGTRDAADLGPAIMIDRDSGSWEQALRQYAAQQEQRYGLASGSLYDPSDLEGIQRNASYAANAGMDPATFLQNQFSIYDTRAASGGSRDAGGYNTDYDDDDPNRFRDPLGLDYRTGTRPGTSGPTPTSTGSSYQPSNTSAPSYNIPTYNYANTGGVPPTGGQTGQPGQPGYGTINPELAMRNNILYEQLLARSLQGLGVTRDDPAVRAQADAYAANEERARRDYMSNVAESAGPYANLQGEARMAAERMGQRTGTFEAELMGREIQARREEIQLALAQMGNLLTEEQRLALQRELGLLNNALQNRGLSIQESLGVYGNDIDIMRALMSSGQFYADLGLRAEDQYNYWNDPLRTTVSR